jgi:MFS transporter, PPP family, 3-phenylpropionic acid transporter
MLKLWDRIHSFCQTLGAFLVLYAALYAGFGVQSPFLPSLLASRDLRPEAIALVLACGGVAGLVAGPAAGRLADRLGAPKRVLFLCAAAAALIQLAYLPARGLLPVLAVGVLHAAALAPLAPLSDTLILGSAAGPSSAAGGRLNYGWARGTGSAAFIAGSVLSGQAVAQFGIAIVVWLNAILLGAAACVSTLVSRLPPVQRTAGGAAKPGLQGIRALLSLPVYRRVLVVAALVISSHAMHDSFAVIMWSAAGVGPGTAGLLWSLSVAAEVVVFLLIGRRLLDWLGPAGAAMLASAAGIVRWTVMAETAWLPALAAVEPLHGLTFALLHLNCMRILARTVSWQLAATALTFYGTTAIGAPVLLSTLASGQLYAHFGAHGFLVMAALCAAALPAAWGLRGISGEPM